jgi:hypothetical protein
VLDATVIGTGSNVVLDATVIGTGSNAVLDATVIGTGSKVVLDATGIGTGSNAGSTAIVDEEGAALVDGSRSGHGPSPQQAARHP